MANEQLSYDELKSWYDAFNTMISKYGGNITELAVPTGNSHTLASETNKVFNKIEEFTTDEYLKTQLTLYDTDYTLVAAGTKMIRSSLDPIATTAANISAIKCRNKATNTNGHNGNGLNYNGTKGYARKTDNGQTYQWNVNGKHTNGSDSHGTHQNGSKIDILNANTST